jgi:hypothetical protein
LENILKYCINLHGGIIGKININCTLEDMKGEVKKTHTFFSPFMRYLDNNFIFGNVMAAADTLITSLNLFAEDASGYKLSSINFMEVSIGKYKPFRGRGFVDTPKEIGRRNVINIKTTNQNCFMLSILCGLKRNEIYLPGTGKTPYRNLSKLQKRKLKRKYEKEQTYNLLINRNEDDGQINFAGYEGETSLESITGFEIQNPFISISVFGHEGKLLIPLRVPQIIKENHVDLLLLKKARRITTNVKTIEKNITVDYHYVLIPDINTICDRKGQKRHYLCHYCLQSFPLGLKKHQEICGASDKSRVSFPKDEYYKFTKLFMYEDVPFKIFFTFQTVLNPVTALIDMNSIETQYTNIQ